MLSYRSVRLPNISLISSQHVPLHCFLLINLSLGSKTGTTSDWVSLSDVGSSLTWTCLRRIMSFVIEWVLLRLFYVVEWLCFQAESELVGSSAQFHHKYNWQWRTSWCWLHSACVSGWSVVTVQNTDTKRRSWFWTWMLPASQRCVVSPLKKTTCPWVTEVRRFAVISVFRHQTNEVSDASIDSCVNDSDHGDDELVNTFR